MFGFLRRLFRGRFNPFIFHYHDGTRKRSGDPIEIERAFMVLIGDDWRTQLEGLSRPLPPELVGEELETAQKQRLELETKFLKVIDTAFDVHAYKDGRGLTISRRFALLEGFNLFCMHVIEIGRPFVRPRSRESPGPDGPPPSSGPESSSPAASLASSEVTPLPSLS